MILRRLADAIKRQDWFVVFIEFFIVVAGIFVGLQVNDWNDARKDRQLERSMMQEIRADIQENINRIGANAELDFSTIGACQRVIANIENLDGWSEEIAKDMFRCERWTSPFIISAAYESLKSRGAHMISSEDVRRSIIGLYEDTFRYLVNDIDKFLWNYESNVWLPVVNHFLRQLTADSYVPVDYQELVQSSEFVNMLYGRIQNTNLSIRSQRDTITQARAVLDLLDEALSQE